MVAARLKRWRTSVAEGKFEMDKASTPIVFETVLPATCNRPTYHLRGVMQHHGEHAWGGHYTCFVRSSDNCWYYCNDSAKPKKVSKNVVLAAQAYVLVYETC